MTARPRPCPAWCSDEGFGSAGVTVHRHHIGTTDDMDRVDLRQIGGTTPGIDIEIGDWAFLGIDTDQAELIANTLRAVGHTELADLIQQACDLIDPPKSESPGAPTPEPSDSTETPRKDTDV